LIEGFKISHCVINQSCWYSPN